MRDPPEDRGRVGTAHELRKRCGSTVAVADLSFEVAEGKIFGLLGPNGSGKTTTVECLQGLRRPDAGTLAVFGHDPRTRSAQTRHLVGSQLQDSALPDRMKVWEALKPVRHVEAGRPAVRAAARRVGPHGAAPDSVRGPLRRAAATSVRRPWMLGGAGPPREVLPDSLITIGDAIPATYAGAALRGPWLGQGWDASAVLFIAAMLAVCAAATGWRLRSDSAG